MKRSDYMLLIMTFLLGLFAGSYFYVTAYKPSMEEQKQILTAPDWELTGVMKGDCAIYDTCVEFYLASNRSYRYVEGSAAYMETGRISRSLRNELADLLVAKKLEPLASVYGCTDDVNGKEYVYTVTTRDDTYTLSTCDRVFAESEVADTLESLWPVLVGGEGEASEPVEGVSGWLENYLHQQFSGE